jgi:YVTN family beta-propeller protein
MSRNIKSFSLILFFVFQCYFNYAQSTSHKLLRKIPISGDGKWDFVTFDQLTRRLYISHATLVQVLDVDKETVLGEIPNTPGVHGVAIVNELAKGYTSNGKDSSVTVFDTKTFKTLGAIKLKGNNPDHIIYDMFSKNVFVFNNKSSDVSVIDPKTDKILQTVALGGFPELAVSDGNGVIYVNLENTHEIVVLNVNSRSTIVKTRFSLKPGEEPTGLGYDVKNKRLFAGCANKLLVVIDAENGKVVTTLPIGEKVDGVEFDPITGLIYTSNGEGTLTIIKQESANQYAVMETLPTAKGAKTLAIDLKKHLIYIPSAEFSSVTPLADGTPQKPTISKGTFGVLVVGK